MHPNVLSDTEIQRILGLEDYQLQMTALEQKNKERLLQARREQESYQPWKANRNSHPVSVASDVIQDENPWDAMRRQSQQLRPPQLQKTINDNLRAGGKSRQGGKRKGHNQTRAG